MDFKFNFAASGAESGTDAGFKFNFGSNDDEVSSAVESLSALRITPQGHFVAKEVKIEGKGEELDEMAIEALFEEMHFRNREPLKRCRPPNSESLEGPIAEVIDKSDLASGVYEGGFKVTANLPSVRLSTNTRTGLGGIVGPDRIPSAREAPCQGEESDRARLWAWTPGHSDALRCEMEMDDLDRL